jgi:hypothetical protein
VKLSGECSSFKLQDANECASAEVSIEEGNHNKHSESLKSETLSKDRTT